MSAIQWTDETWNWLVGCSRTSPGCANCYAADAAKSARLQQFPQYQAVKEWDGTVQFVESQLDKPLKRRKPTRYFTCSMSDVFHENVSDEWRDRAFAVMALTPWHTYQVLTKRPDRMLEYMRSLDLRRLARYATPFASIAGVSQDWKLPLPNVWLGTTVENQAMADKRIPLLLQTPAVIRFLSCEPLLEEVSIEHWLHLPPCPQHPNEVAAGWGHLPCDCHSHIERVGKINWLIAGGESGPKARECRIDWLRSLASQCQAANVPVFVKQLGSKAVDVSQYKPHYRSNNRDYNRQIRMKLANSKGGDISEWPEDLRIREFPAIASQKVTA